ncbi:MAG: YdiU family protein [Campylobacterota bacterium]|nr:YdiU family protein [Campylobacterota bacterium]
MKNIKLEQSNTNLNKNFYSYVEAKPLIKPYLISYNSILADELDISLDILNSNDFVDFINGKNILENQKTFAYAYSGHQFGYFVPNLGDGRALNLGKIKSHHLQTKGSGITPYSRDGDGRAVLRSSIREYLMSEAMYGLGIPTTRVLGIIGSDTKAYRAYDTENCAIVLRTSTSWIRFGSFEFAYMGKNKKEQLENMANFLIDENYPHLKNKDNRYEELYFEIVDKTIELISLWQSVGFMHGVMNTDNISANGLTIDYGPYAMMEQFDKSFVCNLSDNEGRYSFENQPYIAQWNLSVLAKVLSPIADEKVMNSYNDMFIGRFKKRYFELMGQKLGLIDFNFNKDKNLIAKLFKAMEDDEIDYTSFFYNLSNNKIVEGKNIDSWIVEYKKRCEEQSVSNDERLTKMKKVNPKYILRNYMLQDAIDEALKGDFTLVNDFLKIAQNPFGDYPKYGYYTKPKTNWEPLKCSCSS